MDIGMIGMGRMGGNMAERIRQGGHRVVGYDRDPDTRSSAAGRGIDVACQATAIQESRGA